MILRDLEVEFSSQECPDWAYARNRRVILKRPLAEWSSSASSSLLSFLTPHGNSKSIAPIRDSPYEGLFGIAGNENWKFLDSLPIGICLADDWVDIIPRQVKFRPWKALYVYSLNYLGVTGKLEVGYYLLSTRQKCALRISLSTDLLNFEKGIGYLVIDPIIDIRHMYNSSLPEQHSVLSRKSSKGYPALEVWRDGHYLLLVPDSKEALLSQSKRNLTWLYKLGKGERIDTSNGIGFLGEDRRLLAPATVTIPVRSGKKETTNLLVLWSTDHITDHQLNSVLEHHIADEHSEIEECNQMLSSFNIDTGSPISDAAIAVRLVTLSKFCMAHIDPLTKSCTYFPEAGSWWFRTVWLRDVYEGLLNNIQTLLRIPGGREFMRNMIMKSIQLIEPNFCGLPNKLPEFAKEYDVNGHLPKAYYNSSDATLLFLLFSCRFVSATHDLSLGVDIVSKAMQIIDGFESGDLNKVDGHAVISNSTGLLLTVPSHSWADSCKDLQIGDITVPRFPLRVPVEWIDYSYPSSQIFIQYHIPKYYLPEINALWIQVLDGLLTMLRSDLKFNVPDDQRLSFVQKLEKLLFKAKSAFKEVFWNEEQGFLYNIVSNDLKMKDATETSFAVTAASLLDDLLSYDDIRRIWSKIRNILLVFRRLVMFEEKEMRPFGILVRNSSQRIYYGDSQYHEAVVWPRDVPYLIHLLERIGENTVVRDLLLNSIDHQMTECAIFYNSELFSLPEGRNPYPGKFSFNPIPMKNPAQWWSHWTDPFLHFFNL